jgi:hypothetical protein
MRSRDQAGQVLTNHAPARTTPKHHKNIPTILFVLIRLPAIQKHCQSSENAHLSLLLADCHRQLPAKGWKSVILRSKVQESAG